MKAPHVSLPATPEAPIAPTQPASSAPVLQPERTTGGRPLPDGWLASVIVIWCGQAASVFSTCAASFAAIWYITETTSSPVWLSLASAASLLPVALLGPLGGVAADRFDRKRDDPG